MKKASILGGVLAGMAVLAAGPAVAQISPEPAPAVAAPAIPAAPPPTPPAACPSDAKCIPALTVVTLKIGATLGSKLSVSGQTFPIMLAEPIEVDGQQLIPAGVTGMGEVVHAKKTGVGVGGELVLAARYLDFNGQQIRLRSMQLGGKGKDNEALTFAVGVTVGLPALFIRGKHIEVPEGSLATAKIAAQVVLPQPQAVAAPAAPEPEENPTGGNANGS
jgi:hypothetical protein